MFPVKKIKGRENCLAKLDNAPVTRENLIPKTICWYNQIIATLIYLRKHIYNNRGRQTTFLSISHSDPIMKMVSCYFSCCAICLA